MQRTPPRRNVAGAGRMSAYLLIAAALGAVGVVIARSHRPDDDALRRALLGTWQALDPTNAALHRRDQPVAAERITFRPDGTLLYSLEMASRPGALERDLWGWTVRHGRLFVRFLGPEGTKQWLPSFAFRVGGDRLEIRMSKHPTKRFVRR